ncbi:YtxH domain-containing protein [Pedobacter duraquae]|uniref:Uncharacterized protein n=1 Tax=Pedobacter duraquae TaxID=425511 RepID=A0A4R6IM77_9SPHI|nr:YtxH domain-containing protein [Pedobacter duraquae]TDO23260.1 hypothetical protein CLV32_2249 [Pedobacter duraquae]
MGLLKMIIVGAAVAAGVKYATKKRVEDGRSLVDDFKDNIPEWKEKAMQFKEKIRQDYASTADNYNGL